METTFERMHREGIVGKLTTCDRMIVNGYLTGFFPDGAFARFLSCQGILLKDFGEYVKKASDRVKTHAQELAARLGRPFIYLPHVQKQKDDMAKEIARKDGITEGLICVLSTLELRSCFAVEGSREKHSLQAVRRLRKCLHLYFYLIDPDLGFMHVRLQTWFPFEVQIYVNGREWLARQMDKRGVGYDRHENTFLHIDKLAVARKLCERFAHREWSRVWDAYARRLNPWLPTLEEFGVGSYYWVIDQCEIATDVMWRDRKSLTAIMADLFDHAVRAFSADDVMRFLGRKLMGAFRGEVITDHKKRPEGRRVKHRIKGNWIKMYDKWSVLRVETTINKPRDFKVLRVVEDKRGRKKRRWMPMGKGVANLWRFLQIGELANHRYLEALSHVQPKGEIVAELDDLCRSRVVDGKRFARFNPVANPDVGLFQAVMAGEHAINGLRNRDLRARLYPRPPRSPEEARRRCTRASRLLRKLRGHGLLGKVPKSRLYRVTRRGQRLMSAALHVREVAFPQQVARAS